MVLKTKKSPKPIIAQWEFFSGESNQIYLYWCFSLDVLPKSQTHTARLCCLAPSAVPFVWRCQPVWLKLVPLKGQYFWSTPTWKLQPGIKGCGENYKSLVLLTCKCAPAEYIMEYIQETSVVSIPKRGQVTIFPQLPDLVYIEPAFAYLEWCDGWVGQARQLPSPKHALLGCMVGANTTATCENKYSTVIRK